MSVDKEINDTPPKSDENAKIRDLAEHELKLGRFDLALRGLNGSELSLAKVIENYRVYQAELEIQNQELRESRLIADNALQRFSGLFRTLPLPAILIDHTGVVLEANNQAIDMFAFTPKPYHRYFFPKRIVASSQSLFLNLLRDIQQDQVACLEALEIKSDEDDPLKIDAYVSLISESHGDIRNFAVILVDRTECLRQREKLEEAHSVLEASEARYRMLVEHSNDVIFTLSSHGQFEYISPNWVRITGYSSESESNNLFNLVHPEDHQPCRVFCNRILRENTFEELEFRIRCQSGEYHWFAFTGRPINNLTIKNMILGSARFIDGRKKAEALINRQSELLRKRIAELSAIYTISELSKQDIPPNLFFERLLEAIPSGMEHPDSLSVEIRLGEERFEQWSVNDENVINCLSSDINVESFKAGDIKLHFHVPYCNSEDHFESEKKQSFVKEIALLTGRYLELRRSKEKLRFASKVFENSHEGILITDANAKIISVNPAFTRITGYTQDEVIGKNPNLLDSGQHDKKFFANMWKDISASGCWHGELFNRRKSGEIYPQMLSVTRVLNQDTKQIEYIGLMMDLTNLRQAEDRIRQLANLDPLTGLPNRSLLRDRVNQAILQGSRSKFKTGVLYLDLDHFKFVNDSLGHPIGDELLLEMAKRMQDSTRESDTVSRLGGDEFVVVTPNVHSTKDIAEIAQKLLSSLCKPFRAKDLTISPSASIGICVHPDDGRDFDTLLQKADIALYQAKESGRNAFKFFTEDMNHKIQQRVSLEAAMRNALANGEFFLVYQPQYDLNRRCIVGVEALLRWQHPTRGLVAPADFIPLAEETRLICDIGYFVLQTAARQNKVWLDCGHNLVLAINVSSTQFRFNNIQHTITQEIEAIGLPPQNLELELTESVLFTEKDVAMQVAMSLSELGMQISIDDFGTGYSNLNYLLRFSVDKLKIDQSFIQKVPADKDSCAIVSAIVNMAHQLGMTCLAEGVETKEQFEFLKTIGCDQIQGYLLSKPLASEHLTCFLKEFDSCEW